MEKKPMTDITVFGFPASSFVHIVRLVLTHKEVPYTETLPRSALSTECELTALWDIFVLLTRVSATAPPTRCNEIGDSQTIPFFG